MDFDKLNPTVCCHDRVHAHRTRFARRPCDAYASVSGARWAGFASWWSAGPCKEGGEEEGVGEGALGAISS